ncbi:MAG: hypothetical protein VB064_12870 [Oscillospiraceae bacterium]|nr:hypothetical protein [Oscillospiraceae bacterium]
MYIEYAEFTEKGGSAIVTETAFTALEYRAQKIVDQLTQKRVQSMAAVPAAVKFLMVELINIESVGGSQAILSPSVASFSNDGYSETYAEPVTAEVISEAKSTLIRQYLSGEVDDEGTPLLWLGVS